MDKFVEYDPYLGVRTTTYLPDDDDEIHVIKEQDVQPLLDRNKEAANAGSADSGIQRGLWHYASVPVVVQHELLKKGLNIHNRHDMPKILDEINKNYPFLKTTHKTHGIGSSKPSRSQKPENSTPHGPYVIVR